MKVAHLPAGKHEFACFGMTFQVMRTMLYWRGRMVSTAHWKEVVSLMTGKLLQRIFLTLLSLESLER